MVKNVKILLLLVYFNSKVLEFFLPFIFLQFISYNSTMYLIIYLRARLGHKHCFFFLYSVYFENQMKTILMKYPGFRDPWPWASLVLRSQVPQVQGSSNLELLGSLGPGSCISSRASQGPRYWVLSLILNCLCLPKRLQGVIMEICFAKKFNIIAIPQFTS